MLKQLDLAKLIVTFQVGSKINDCWSVHTGNGNLRLSDAYRSDGRRTDGSFTRIYEQLVRNTKFQMYTAASLWLHALRLSCVMHNCRKEQTTVHLCWQLNEQ